MSQSSHTSASQGKDDSLSEVTSNTAEQCMGSEDTTLSSITPPGVGITDREQWYHAYEPFVSWLDTTRIVQQYAQRQLDYPDTVIAMENIYATGQAEGNSLMFEELPGELEPNDELLDD